MNEKRNLRKLAEKKLSKKDLDYSDKEDMKDILHELQVHQLELEQQNQEMKKIQEELVKMRDKYHLLFEMAPIAYFNFNNKGVILNSNLKAARMLKVEKKHLIYKPFIIYLPSSSQEQFYQHLKTVVEDKSYKRSELELKNKKGEIREVLLESNYIVDEDYIHSAVIDITERKNMEKKLIESQHYNESIVKAIPDIIIRIDTSGIFEDVITGKNSKLFMPADELEGKNVYEIFEKEETAHNFLRKIKKALREDETQTIKYNTDVPEGNRWFEARIVPLFEEEVLTLIRDINDRVEKEEIIQDYTVELELKQMELEDLYHKLDKEINKAKRIHEKTITYKDPDIVDISFSSYYQPAEKMGGDFYDIIRSDNKIVFYVSDVTGHGLDAAMLSSFIKSTVNSYVAAVPEKKITPTAIIKFLAAQFCKEDYPDDYFICINLAVLNLDNYKLHYNQLGIQDPIIKCNKNGEKEKLVNKGLPISTLFSEELLEFAAKTVELKPGDTVVLNTDGITEQKVNGDYYLNRFHEVICKYSGNPTCVISQNIKEDFYDFNGSSQGDDDITYLILQVKPEDKKEYDFKIKSREDDVKKLRGKIKKIIPSTYNGDMMVMGIHELVVNALEHGNKFDESKNIMIKIMITDDYFYAVIEDEGPGFGWESALNKKVNIKKLSDSGKGLMMVREGCDHISFNQKGNRAYLVKFF